MSNGERTEVGDGTKVSLGFLRTILGGVCTTAAVMLLMYRDVAVQGTKLESLEKAFTEFRADAKTRDGDRLSRDEIRSMIRVEVSDALASRLTAK